MKDDTPKKKFKVNLELVSKELSKNIHLGTAFIIKEFN